MWRLVWFFAGWHRLRVTGASPQWVLGAMAKRRVAFRDFQKKDEFTVELTIPRRSLAAAAQAAKRAMCEMELLQSGGLPVLFSGLRRRPLLPVLMSLAAVAAFVCTRFVWFYSVSGNDRVPAERIVRELEELGVGFGTFGPDIQPQWLKNHMLCRIPELSWLTVTQNGMCAVVTVRERPEEEPVADRRTARNVVAARGGVLTRVSVLEGNALCAAGDVVQEGQLLVSAYTDWGYKTQVSGALAEIYAQTARRVSLTLPQTALEKQYSGAREKTVSLVLGRKRWKIFGRAGFSGGKCDTMTVTHKIVLPGGYSLPIAIEITTRSDYDTVETTLPQQTAREQLEQLARTQTQQDMIAGTIVDARCTMQSGGGAYRLYAAFRCEEMIARMVDAGIFKDDGNADD